MVHFSDSLVDDVRGASVSVPAADEKFGLKARWVPNYERKCGNALPGTLGHVGLNLKVVTTVWHSIRVIGTDYGTFTPSSIALIS